MVVVVMEVFCICRLRCGGFVMLRLVRCVFLSLLLMVSSWFC